MADERSNEILMQLVDSAGQQLEAESQVDLDSTKDPLLKGFSDGKFFSVDDFAFGMNIDDKDPAAGIGGTRGLEASKISSGPQVKFGKWKSGSPEEIKKIVPFPLRMDEFSLTRRFDKLSPVLFQCCARSVTFKSASLVKRKTVGTVEQADKFGLLSFLRLDFTDVLVTHVGWDDAEVIKETVRFIFRGVTMQYCQQEHDGRLKAPGSVSWNYSVDLKK
jgi:type VI protein secretion system component Hcp